MPKRRNIATILLVTGLSAGAVRGGDLGTTVSSGDYHCPAGHRLMAQSVAQNDAAKICNTLNDWQVARLAGHASLAGPALNCKLRLFDPRKLRYSLCIPHQDVSSIRGVLLQGGFRSQPELNQMSPQDWRQTLITELANRTAGTSHDYALLDNPTLAGTGALVLHLNRSLGVTPENLALLDIATIRQIVIRQLQAQTGLPLQQLERLSNLELEQLLRQG